MLIADPVISVAHLIDGDLSILVRKRNQLASRMLLRGRAFVGVDMRVIAAQNRVVGTIQRLQPKYVGSGPVEGKKHIDARAKVFLEFRDGGAGVIIVAVSADVPLVGARNRVENLGMDSSIVVAGKTTHNL